MFDRGHAGASVRREHDRRRRNREIRTLNDHPRVGRVLLALKSEPPSERAFLRGELGELAVAESLEQRTVGGPAIVLYDRRMPGGYGNIDLLAIAPTGVFVVDAKNYKGKVRIVKPLLGAPALVIAGRNRTKLLDGLDRQVTAVRDALGSIGHPRTPVQGVLCFTTADLPLLGTQRIRGHLLLYRKALARKLNAAGSLSPSTIDALARALAAALPPA